MPVYTYRREDGTTFDIKQAYADAPLSVDPESGQKVVRVIQSTGVIFKGSGFYVTDSKDASKRSLNSATKKTDTESKTETASTPSAEAASD